MHTYNNVYRMLTACLALVCCLCACAQRIGLRSDALSITISEDGHYQSIQVNGRELISSGRSPLVTACTGGKLILPQKAVQRKNQLVVTMQDQKSITLDCHETPNCIVMEATKVPAAYDAILFGPVKVNIHDVVGDVVGVVQGDGIALGMQAMNIKTIAGIPDEYVEEVQRQFPYKGKGAELSVGTTPDFKLAAVDLDDGACFQLSCRNRSRKETRTVMGVKGAMVLPVKGPDALVSGARIALFGCPADQALERIGAIEVEQGLPHPLFDGEWGKTSRAAMRSYLISDFREQDFDFILDKAEKAGFTYVYQSGPFNDWGHFNWSTSVSATGDDGIKAMVEKAAKRGIKMGVHTLSNFTTTNDAYVTPTPSPHLLKQGELAMKSAIDDKQTEIRISRSTLFDTPLTLNGLMIDSELITYGTVEEDGTDGMLLKGCKRGAFGTTAAAHAQDTPLYKLWDYPYRTFFPDLELQDSYTARLIEMFNNTGLGQISFDGLEGCSYTGQDEYAPTRFVEQFYRGVRHNVLNDASRLNHYTWHIHSRMNWGEPWGEAMRTGQVENRIKNQNYFRRNLFPRMLGWFLIRLADHNFECSTLEDLEWALAEAAGFDAGYAMTINTGTLRRHGRIDELLEAIRNWDMLRERKCFTPEQMERLKDPSTEWHLEKTTDNNTFALYPLSITKHFRCSLGEMQPGQPGGADWSVSSPYAGAYALRLKVEGNGAIQNPQFMTPQGTVSFPCTVEAGQYLLYSFDGKASITDVNFNLIGEVTPQGKAVLGQGDTHVAFSCECNGGSAPDVLVRFITRGEPETVVAK